jgi:hypothetical protein
MQLAETAFSVLHVVHSGLKIFETIFSHDSTGKRGCQENTYDEQTSGSLFLPLSPFDALDWDFHFNYRSWSRATILRREVFTRMLLPLSANNLKSMKSIPMFFDVMCNYPPAKIISGYSEYSNQMDSNQRALIISAAQEVVISFDGNTPIVAISVIGHADTALRKPVKERADFEADVSLKRATAATKDLKDQIEMLGRGKNPETIKIVRFREPIGMGSTKKLISNPLTESQMKLNRRVEIYFGQCTVPPQWTWRDAAQRGLALVKDDTDAHKRIRCMLDKILHIPDAQDGYFDYQTFRQLYILPGSTDQQREELIKKHIDHLEEKLGHRDIFGLATEVSDEGFIKGLEHIDEIITRSIRDFDFAGPQSGTSVLVVRAWRVIQVSRTEDKSIYKCYASYHHSPRDPR